MGVSERFGSVVCDYQDQFRIGFMFGLLLLLFTLVSIPFLEPGTAVFAIALIDLFLVLGLIMATGTAHWCCVRYRQQNGELPES